MIQNPRVPVPSLAIPCMDYKLFKLTKFNLILFIVIVIINVVFGIVVIIIT